MSAESHESHENHDMDYVKVWGVLLALLVVSIVGPLFEIRALTLITAFGIAVVKAYLVATRFMHINIERRYITYMVTTCLVFMFLFFAGTAPDVMKSEGSGWEKPAWKAEQAAWAAGELSGDGHGEGGHGEGESH